MQEEVDQKTIALAVKTGKLTAQVLQAAIRKYLAARQKETGKAHHGQQSLRQLKKDGSALSNIEITDANIGLFKPCAENTLLIAHRTFYKTRIRQRIKLDIYIRQRIISFIAERVACTWMRPLVDMAAMLIASCLLFP